MEKQLHHSQHQEFKGALSQPLTDQKFHIYTYSQMGKQVNVVI